MNREKRSPTKNKLFKFMGRDVIEIYSDVREEMLIWPVIVTDLLLYPSGFVIELIGVPFPQCPSINNKLNASDDDTCAE